MSYGLPGKPGYSYTRPFDYFHFELTTLGNTDNPVENVMIRGLLFGKDYAVGNPIAGYGASMAAMTTFRRTSSASQAPPHLWVLPINGGSHTR